MGILALQRGEDVKPAGIFYSSGDEPPRMPQIHLDEETVERLDALRVDDEEYDEIVSELISIYEAEELTLFRGSDVE
ncbi:hypothetical protein GCM10009060_07720 [Halorubrum trapanicum]